MAIVTLIGPLALIGALEGGLRPPGFGFSPRFTLTRALDGTEYRITNTKFSW